MSSIFVYMCAQLLHLVVGFQKYIEKKGGGLSSLTLRLQTCTENKLIPRPSEENEPEQGEDK